MQMDPSNADMMAVTAHKMRTPLESIKWVIEKVLLQEKLSKDSREYLTDAHASSERLLDVVDALLAISRIEHGKEKPGNEEVDLVKLISEMLAIYTPLHKDKGMQSTFDDRPESLIVRSDTHILQNILEPIITNAFIYSKASGIVKASLKEEEDMVEIRITDTGIGIPASEQDKIFNKFERGGNAQKMVPEGTGLGLYVAEQSAHILGGQIKFESKEGEGTTFVITIPRNRK